MLFNQLTLASGHSRGHRRAPRCSCMPQLQQPSGASTQVNPAKMFRAENTDYDSLASPFSCREILSVDLSNEKVCATRTALPATHLNVKATRAAMQPHCMYLPLVYGHNSPFRRRIFDESNSALCYSSSCVNSARLECVKHGDEDAPLTAAAVRKYGSGALRNAWGSTLNKP